MTNEPSGGSSRTTVWIVALIALAAGAAAVAFGGSREDGPTQAAPVPVADGAENSASGAQESPATTIVEDSAAAPGSGDSDTAGSESTAQQQAAPAVEVAGQTASVAIVGENLPPMPQVNGPTNPESDSAIGLVAPALTGSDFEGNVVTIAADGRAKAVYFLAHWCPHCQVEVPMVQGIIDAGGKPQGLDVYAVSTAVAADRGNYPPRDWFRVERWSSPVMLDDAQNSAVISYGAGGFPYAVFLDGENRVITRAAGELPAELTQEIWSFVVSL